WPSCSFSHKLQIMSFQVFKPWTGSQLQMMLSMPNITLLPPISRLFFTALLLRQIFLPSLLLENIQQLPILQETLHL
ncbi:hypothetical protein HDU76_010344, partial [Blyttiomyces sp. JEL0837]